MTDALSKRHIAIVGEMGVGKTTTGHGVAAALDRPFLDSDDHIEARYGERGALTAANSGVAELHRRELEMLVSVADNETPAVIAPAASVVDSEVGREILAGTMLIWLVASDEVLAERQARGDHRRRVDASERLALRQRREGWLAGNAALRIDTGALDLDGVIEKVVEFASR